MSKTGWCGLTELRALYNIASTLSHAELTYCVGLIVNGQSKRTKPGVELGDTWAGPEKIAEESGCGIRQIKGAAAEVKRRGIVKIIEQGRRGHRGVLRVVASQLSAGIRTDLIDDDSVRESAPDKPDSVRKPVGLGAETFTNSVRPAAPSPTQSPTVLPNTRVHAHPPRKNPDASITPGHAEIVRAFCDAWKARYAISYKFGKGKDGAMIKRLLIDAGDAAEAKRLITSYFADSDPWLQQQTHPLGILVANLNKYRVRLAGGSDIDFENAVGPFKPRNPTAAEVARVVGSSVPAEVA